MVCFLGIVICLLTGALGYALLRNRRLKGDLISRTDLLLRERDGWRAWQKQVHLETGLESAADLLEGYRRLCKSIGYSLHNWTTERDLSPERSIQLGALGNLLREVASSQRQNQEGPPQVKGWVDDSRPNYGTGKKALKRAGSEFGPLLDGLTLKQLTHLTVMLLDKQVTLEGAFMSIHICLLTPNRWEAERLLENYVEAAGKRINNESYSKAVRAGAEAQEARWRALIKPRRDADEAITRRQWEARAARQPIA